MPPKKDNSPLYVQRLAVDERTFKILGLTPIYHNRMSAKAKQQLLVGGQRKTVADRRELKHNPFEEFRDSLHHCPGLNPNTDLGFPAVGVKAALATAALVVSGIAKTDVQRLVFLPEEMIPIYGVPRLRMDVTRNADPKRTPGHSDPRLHPRLGSGVPDQVRGPGALRVGDRGADRERGPRLRARRQPAGEGQRQLRRVPDLHRG